MNETSSPAVMEFAKGTPASRNIFRPPAIAAHIICGLCTPYSEREGVSQGTTMPPKRGKKGKRRGDSSSDDDASNLAAAAVMASLKQPAPTAEASVDGSEDAAGAAAPGKAKQARGKAKGKKKGKGGRNNNDSDSDDGDALDPLAHLRGGRGKAGKRAGLDSDDDEERPKKPLTKKEKRRLEEEQRRREKEVRQF